jgi:hypothetical protein
MTAPSPKTTITPEWIDWFARYYSNNQAWGVFHVWLDDGNCKIAYVLSDSEKVGLPTDVLEAARWFALLSPSQKERLGRKAEDRAYELGLLRRVPVTTNLGSVRCVAIDRDAGILTVESTKR